MCVYVLFLCVKCVSCGGRLGGKQEIGGIFSMALEYVSLFLVLLHLFIYLGGGVQVNKI